MRLKTEWRRIVKKAWSIRLAILAALFSGLEVILPLFVDLIPRNTFAALSFFAVIAATIARLVQQDNLKDN